MNIHFVISTSFIQTILDFHLVRGRCQDIAHEYPFTILVHIIMIMIIIMLVHLYCAPGGDAADIAQAIGELSPDTQLGLKLVIQSLGKGTGKFDLPYFPPLSLLF